MFRPTAVFVIASLILSCSGDRDQQVTAATPSLPGTWQLCTGTLIENGDTVTTDYTKGQQMIKVINATHFSFLRHDLGMGKDSAFFSAGGGRYTLEGDRYTEYLDYCSDREWEGHEFSFGVVVTNDSLVQTGVERLDNLGIDRLNIERYVRLKE